MFSPLHKHEGKHSGDRSAQARRHEGHSGAVILKSFLCPPNCVVLRKMCFKQKIKTKIFPPKNVFPPQTLKPGYGADSAEIVSAIRIFCFEGHSHSRCSIRSKTFFYKPHQGMHCKHFWGGGRVGLLRHCIHVVSDLL